MASKKKEPEIIECPAPKPSLELTEYVTLSLARHTRPDFTGSSSLSYYQTATTEDLRAFAVAAERRFGIGAPVTIISGAIQATQKKSL